MKHYEFVPDDTIEIDPGKVLHRIRATTHIEIHGVKPGELGGYIETHENLDGDQAWVSGNALVDGRFAECIAEAQVTNPEVLADTLTANTDIHTCSYYCERPECVKAQRDELRDRMESVLSQQPASPSGAVNVVGMPEFDDLMDHIYEHGTTADGVVERANALARAVLARYAPHPTTTHCDACGCDRLDNGLNPVGCPYCNRSELAAENERLRAEVERADTAEALLRQVLEVLGRAHHVAMEQTLKARIPECGEFAGIAQDLDFVVATLRERLEGEV